MRTSKESKPFRVSGLRISAGCLILLMFLMLSCQEQDIDPVMTDDVAALEARQPGEITTNDANLRQISKDGPIHLSGVQNYYTYAVKMNEVLQDGDVDCIAILDFLEGHNIQLTLTEFPGTPYERTSILIGSITPSGIVKFTFKFPGITDIIELHSGCVIYGGPGVNNNTLIYSGTFNGERLIASAPFYTKCETTSIPPIEPVEGPVHWRWTIDVTVD